MTRLGSSGHGKVLPVSSYWFLKLTHTDHCLSDCRQDFLDFSKLPSRGFHFVDLPLLSHFVSGNLDKVLPGPGGTLPVLSSPGQPWPQGYREASASSTLKALNWTIEMSALDENQTMAAVPDFSEMIQHISTLHRYQRLSAVYTMFRGIDHLPDLAEIEENITFKPWLRDLAKLTIHHLQSNALTDWSFLPTIDPTALSYIRPVETHRYIAAHWRRGDFEGVCPSWTDSDVSRMASCWPTLDAAIDQLNIIRETTCAGKCPVVIATNTDRPDEIGRFRAEGFTVLNHTSMQTNEMFGPFAASFIDLTLFDQATVFVGNEYSTLLSPSFFLSCYRKTRLTLLFSISSGLIKRRRRHRAAEYHDWGKGLATSNAA